MLETGKILQERYRVERQIGQGGMGSVYLATDSRFNSTVAIKETPISDDNFRKALGREARLLNSLKHTALPKVSDHFIEENGQYIVMEYISGEDLYEMMERSGTAFPIDDIQIWAEQLLDALEYLHNQENPIIHRDIKPQNLKLTPQGQIVLLDFGLAKGNPTDANHKTAANSIFGYSRHYASLEQIQGTGTDPRSDIYSLAATLYHLATGKPPADALTRVMDVMNEEPDPLIPANLVHEQVDEEFAAALGKCMSLNANLRPQSASEMYELLFSEQKTVATSRTKASAGSSEISGLSTQNTKILPADPGSGGTRPADVRTEVMGPEVSDSDSVATRMAGPSTGGRTDDATLRAGLVTNSSGGKRRIAAIAGALILLVTGTVVSMVYFWDGGGSPADSKATFSDSANAPAENAETPFVETVAEDAAANETGPPDGETASTAATGNTAGDRQHSGSKPPAPGTAPPGPTELDLEELKALEKELGKDFEFSTRKGKIVTDSVIIDKDGVLLRPVRPGEPGIRLPMSEKEFESLTPAQKRRLRNALETRRRMEERRERIESQAPNTVPSPPPAPSPE